MLIISINLVNVLEQFMWDESCCPYSKGLFYFCILEHLTQMDFMTLQIQQKEPLTFPEKNFLLS